MALPWILGGIATITIGTVLKAIFGSDDSPSQSKPKVLAFFGQIGAGKTTICEILS